MKLKKIVFTAVAMVAVCMMTACGKNENTEQQKVNIKIIYPTSRGMGDKTISEFKGWFVENYPDAELELVSSAVATITDTVKSEFRNGNGPDIFVTTEYDTFVNEGYMADITAIEALTKFRKSSVRNLEREGRVYALPMGGGNMIALHYNKSLFDKYDIPYPTTEDTMYGLISELAKVAESEGIEIRPLGASMLYPSQAAMIMNSTLADKTQSTKYLQWMADYSKNLTSFKDDIFQVYLGTIDYMINKKKDADGNTIIESGKLFGRDDFFSTQAASISSFLNGASFMYVGDAMRCYDAFGTEGSYDKSDIGVMGIPIGMEGVSYVSYMDELYIGVNSEFDNFSDRKKHIIEDVLDHIASGDTAVRNIFTFTGEYTSDYLEGHSVDKIDEKYFKDINECLDNNYIEQEVNNTPFSSVFGKVLIAWKKGELSDIYDVGDNDIEIATNILELYKTTGVSAFEKSEEPIGTSSYFMEYQSNIVRTQETAIGNQVADMARDYMGTDFALINAGGIRASIPEGSISVQTINSVLPYENYLVKIEIKGSTLKKALEHAYDVGPIYKSGQFGDISGLCVKLETNPEGYAEYTKRMEEWKDANPNATDIQKNAASEEIVEAICDENPDMLNLVLDEVTDAAGNPIEDDKIYTLATLDYLLKGGDDYDMLGVLGDCEDADTSIKIYDRQGNLIEGDSAQMADTIVNTCDSGMESFVNWVKEGHELTSQIDGRISIENFIYVE